MQRTFRPIVGEIRAPVANAPWRIIARKMPSYVIIAPPESALSDSLVDDKFDRWIAIIPNRAWAVSTSLGTCADIRDRLRSKPSSEDSCVIVKATEYNGYAKRDLWEKLEEWERR